MDNMIFPLTAGGSGGGGGGLVAWNNITGKPFENVMQTVFKSNEHVYDVLDGFGYNFYNQTIQPALVAGKTYKVSIDDLSAEVPAGLMQEDGLSTVVLGWTDKTEFSPYGIAVIDFSTVPIFVGSVFESAVSFSVTDTNEVADTFNTTVEHLNEVLNSDFTLTIETSEEMLNPDVMPPWDEVQNKPFGMEKVDPPVVLLDSRDHTVSMDFGLAVVFNNRLDETFELGALYSVQLDGGTPVVVPGVTSHYIGVDFSGIADTPNATPKYGFAVGDLNGTPVLAVTDSDLFKARFGIDDVDSYLESLFSLKIEKVGTPKKIDPIYLPKVDSFEYILFSEYDIALTASDIIASVSSGKAQLIKDTSVGECNLLLERVNQIVKSGKVPFGILNVFGILLAGALGCVVDPYGVVIMVSMQIGMASNEALVEGYISIDYDHLPIYFVRQLAEIDND